MSFESPVSGLQSATATSKHSSSPAFVTINGTNSEPSISPNVSASTSLSIGGPQATILDSSILVPNSHVHCIAEDKTSGNIEAISTRIPVSSLRDHATDVSCNVAPINVAGSTTDIVRLSTASPTAVQPTTTTSEDSDVPNFSTPPSNTILPLPPYKLLVNHAICPLNHITDGTNIFNNAHYTRIVRLHYQVVNLSLAEFVELQCGCLIDRPIDVVVDRFALQSCACCNGYGEKSAGSIAVDNEICAFICTAMGCSAVLKDGGIIKHRKMMHKQHLGRCLDKDAHGEGKVRIRFTSQSEGTGREYGEKKDLICREGTRAIRLKIFPDVGDGINTVGVEGSMILTGLPYQPGFIEYQPVKHIHYHLSGHIRPWEHSLNFEKAGELKCGCVTKVAPNDTVTCKHCKELNLKRPLGNSFFVMHRAWLKRLWRKLVNKEGAKGWACELL
ncbi:hypothetical protein BZA77DRAFT_355483 [Pyronema omphalodes]|nr:hypothetical protein BZA77DRAFT_355483 [Pyronema omphalodes]